MLCIIPLPTLP